MFASDLSIPTGPMPGQRWSTEPITHTLRSHGARHCLSVRTGFIRFALTFALSIVLCLFLFSSLFPQGPLAFWISPLAAFGLAVPLVRFYRSIFLEVTFDTSRQVVELRRRGRVEAVPLGCIVGFQVCHCVDKKATGLIRYHNEFEQLILVYWERDEYRRRLVTAATAGECEELLSRLSEHVKIDVKHCDGELGAE
jgi:hypothetical protein